MAKPIKLPVFIHLYFFGILLVSIILKVQLNLSSRSAIVCCLLLFTISIFPSLKVMYTPLEGGSEMLIFKTIFIITLFSIAIAMSKIPFKFLVISIIFCLYWKHFYLWGTIVTNIFYLHGLPRPLKYKNSYVSNQMEKMFTNSGFRLLNNFGKMPIKPTIIVANYCSDRIENAAYLLIPGKSCVISQFPFLDQVLFEHIQSKGHAVGQFEKIKISVSEKIQKNISIFTYINSPTHSGNIGKISSGMFRIAAELDIPITPICIDRIKTGFLWSIPNQNFCIKVGETFLPKNIPNSIHSVRKFLTNTLDEFDKNKFNSNYCYE